MKYCSNCGTQLSEGMKFCPNCGKAQSQYQQQPNYYNDQPYLRNAQTSAPSQQDGKSFGFALLGFFVPVVGLILYLVWKDEMPLKAKSAGKGALVSVILVVISVIAVFILAGVAVYMGVTDPNTIIDFEEQFGTDIPTLFIR